MTAANAQYGNMKADKPTNVKHPKKSAPKKVQSHTKKIHG